MLVDSDHFAIHLNISLLSPAGRTKSTRQKRNGQDFHAKHGSGLSEVDIKAAGDEISTLHREFRSSHPLESRYECLQRAIANAVDSLPKKKTGKKGWHEGNEKELEEWIGKRNEATLKHALSKTLADLSCPNSYASAVFFG
jgi:hypothetical protein